MPKTKKSTASFTPPPPLLEQKRQRQRDHSIVPSPPYLLASHFLDVACDLPLVRRACPSPEDGGWRSALPNPEWGTFPDGKLSHSFEAWFSPGDLNKDVTFGDYMASVNAGGKAGVGSQGGGGLSTTLNHYYDYAFQTNSTTLGDLSHPLPLSILLVLVLLIRQIKKIVMPIFSDVGLRFGRAAHGPTWENDNAERISKFGEYVYRLCYHSAVSVYGIWYFRDKIWWDPSRGGTTHLFDGHPNHPVEPGMAWYYLVQCAYNVDALLSLVEMSFIFEFVNPLAYSSALDFLEKEHVVDERQRKKRVFQHMAKSRRQILLWTPLFQIKWSPTCRGDFREMMAHHIVTNVLIFVSSYYRFTRIGSMIFLVHDVSDVPIDLSKLANFVKWKVTTIVCFVVMVLMWIICRLAIFPFVICRSAVWESHGGMVLVGNLDPAFHDAFYAPFYFLLAALVMLHVTWFLILLRIGWKLIRTGERHDLSEYKNGEKKHN
eukprot:CAMPEP_0183718094 /NCGR_PEP_ID=MMETSP0737-20130205/11439_1 /TAXON_ID=385413 /ORGANISM="Thalassiosira miniscula, Strain CCMP1093" /LENGTH=487 /DNA_ID=CAMNT_0025947583 /DNA_START=101 /DNA_END=1564 /DNA_ORIENTATION=+